MFSRQRHQRPRLRRSHARRQVDQDVEGAYLQYVVSGTVVIKMIGMNGANVLLSGMFFD